jgi:predicted MFS family arabinose efflux permease
MNAKVDQAGPSLLRAWIAVLVLAVSGFSLGADIYILPALLPTVSSDLHTVASATAQVLTVYGLLAAVGAPVLTFLFRAVDRKALLVGSIAILVVANFLTVFTPSLAWLTGTRVLAGLAAALLAPIRTATAGQVVPARSRARAIGVATAGLSAALVVAAPAALGVATVFGWRAAFAASGAVAAVALLGTLLFVPRVSAAGGSTLREQLGLLRQSRLLLVLLSNVSALCAIFIPLTFLRIVMGRATLLDAAGVSAVFALYGIAGTVANTSAGWLAERFGSLQVMVGGLVVAAVSVGAFSPLMAGPPSGVTTALAVVAVAGWSLGAWSYYALQFHRLMQLAPAAPAAALAWASPATYLGTSVGALLGGLILRLGSVTLIGLGGGLFFLLAAAFVVGAADPRTARGRAVAEKEA